jgi:hypothetical protein
MAGTTGLEPATSAVTGQHSNQLNYVPSAPFDNLSISRYSERLPDREHLLWSESRKVLENPPRPVQPLPRGKFSLSSAEH